MSKGGVDFGFGNGDEFGVSPLFVFGGEHANDATFDETAGGYGLAREDNDVEGILVFTPSLGNEAIVEGIGKSSIEKAVGDDNFYIVVIFIFGVAANGNFDDDVDEFVWVAGGNVVEEVHKIEINVLGYRPSSEREIS